MAAIRRQPLALASFWFPRSLRNLLQNYADHVDQTHCFLNTGTEPDLVFIQTGAERTIFDTQRFQHLVQESER